MICTTFKGYNASCANLAGGISAIWIFDPNDFNFTADATTGAYTAITAMTPPTGETGTQSLYQVNFLYKEAERKFKQSVKMGCFVKFEHEISASLPQLSQGLTTFLSSLSKGACCCGIGVIIQHNDGNIFVMGEKYVNGAVIPRFYVVMDGSEGGSGKLFDDFNGAQVSIKGDYLRELNQFTGLITAITALVATT